MQQGKEFDVNGCYYAAIDIGTTNIKTVVAKQSSDNKIEIVATCMIPSKGVIKGEIRNTNEVGVGISQSIAQIESEFNIKIKQAYVGVSGQHIKFMQKDGYVSINNNEGEVTSNDVIRLSNEMNNIQITPGEAIIHILPQHYRIDSDEDIIEPIGMVGNRLNGIFNIVTGENSKLQLIKRSLNKASVDMANIILNPLASAEAVVIDDAKELGVVVVDLGGGTTDICIYHDKTMRYLGVIPIGGWLINQDIRALGVLERLVEKLKVKFGSAFPDNIPDNQIIKLSGLSSEISVKDLAKAIEARVLDIIEQLDKMISESGFNNKLKGGIILTGGGAQLKDIDKLFARHFGCMVQIAKPTLYVTSDSIDKIDSPEYTTAVGLLLRASIIGNSSAMEFIINEPVTNNTAPVTPQQGVPFTPPTFGVQQGNTQQQTPAAVAPVTNIIQSNEDQYIQDGDQDEIIDNEDEYDNTEEDGQGKNIFTNFFGKLKNIMNPNGEEIEDDNDIR